jgi:hypothetical protein
VPAARQAELLREGRAVPFRSDRVRRPLHTILSNRSQAGACDFDQLAPSMGPAIGELDVRTGTIRCDQPIISGISVHLKDAREPLQYPLGMVTAATWSIGEGHPRRSASAPRSVITGQRPEVSGLGFAGTGGSRACVRRHWGTRRCAPTSSAATSQSGRRRRSPASAACRIAAHSSGFFPTIEPIASTNWICLPVTLLP